jgi:amidohydrolase
VPVLSASELKARVINEIDSRRDQLKELSLRIHSHPETAFQEEKASAWLGDYLRENGFSVEKGICGLPTSFRASYGRGKPALAILAEYDALPKLGHACGHNIIATSAVGAGIAARPAVDELGGRVEVLGTPAEESGGGKVYLIKKGAFRGIDAVMMVHPAGLNTATAKFLALQTLEVEFFGKPAHAAARPEAGINALEAMLMSYAAINSLRQHIRSSARIHGIITDGGEAPNIVPAHTAGRFIVRAEEDTYLEELKGRVLNCFIGAATATGAKLKYQWGKVRYAPLRNNMTIARIFHKNLQSLGRRVHLDDPRVSIGSSDIGNVSQVVPSIHPLIAIASPGTATHSPQFARTAVSEAGIRGLLDAAKAMAMTAVDLLAEPALIAKARKEFEQTKESK